MVNNPFYSDLWRESKDNSCDSFVLLNQSKRLALSTAVDFTLPNGKTAILQRQKLRKSNEFNKIKKDNINTPV